MTTPLTIEDYVALATISSPRISPDERRVVYVVTRVDWERSRFFSDLWLLEIASGDTRCIAGGDWNDMQPRWDPRGRRVAFLSDRSGTTQVWLLSLDGGEASPVTAASTPVRLFEWSPDGESITFACADEAAHKDRAPGDDARELDRVAHVHLHSVTLRDGATTRLTSGEFSVHSCDWASDGSFLVFDAGRDAGLDGLFDSEIRRLDRSAMTTLVTRSGANRGPLVAPDSNRVAFLSSNGVHDWTHEHLVHVVSADGGEPTLFCATNDRTPELLRWSSEGHLYALCADGLTTKVQRMDSSAAVALTPTDHVVSDFDVKRETLVTVEESLVEPAELCIGSRRITAHNAAFAARTVGRTEVVRWASEDGSTLDGLLTLPARSDVPPPLVTILHGGPASRFDLGFSGYLGYVYVPHVLAAHGLAVFRPNPRGTGGYGPRLRAANRNDWTKGPWSDVERGIDHLIERGLVDPTRLGLAGWSYGGYLAAWALTVSDRFAAVSIGAAMSDLLTMHATSDIRDFIPSYFPQMDREQLRAQSPLWHLRPTKSRVLIQHGELDDRVPLSQGVALHRVLRELNVDSTMVLYPRSGHVPKEPRLRVDVARRNVELFTSALLA